MLLVFAPVRKVQEFVHNLFGRSDSVSDSISLGAQFKGLSSLGCIYKQIGNGRYLVK